MSEQQPDPTHPVPPPPGGDVPVPPAPPVPPYVPPAGTVPAPAYPAAPAYPPAGKTSSNAIVALVLAVLSWAVCPLVPAIVALVFANMATKEIAASGGQLEGQGLTTAAKIVAWINIGLWGAGLVVGAFMFVLFAIVGASS